MMVFVKCLPLSLTMAYAFAYFLWMSLAVLTHIMRYMVGSTVQYAPFPRGVVLTLLFGCACSLVVKGFYDFGKRRLFFLGTSFVYAGAFMVTWLAQYDLPFFGRLPRRVTWSRDYVVLFAVFLLCLGIHYAIVFFRSPSQRAAVYNFIRRNF